MIQWLLIRENKSSKILSPGVVYTSVISMFGRSEVQGQPRLYKILIYVYINSVMVEHAIIPALEIGKLKDKISTLYWTTKMV